MRRGASSTAITRSGAIVRDEAKYHRLVAFCAALPALRAAVERDLACPCLCKRKVVATVVALMERAQLRVGNDEYARQNGSYGATTLRDRHAKIHGDTLELAYRGKSGSPAPRSCSPIAGSRGSSGAAATCRASACSSIATATTSAPISSNDVNDYLREITGGPFTAKDYRTWAATLGAALLLCALEHPGSAAGCKRCIKQVLDIVAAKLGHTPAVCRSSYIHPRVLDDFTTNKLAPQLARQIHRRVGDIEMKPEAIDVATLRAIEPVVARYLDRRPRRRHA